MTPPSLTVRPFELGFHAGLRGDDPRVCPFEKLTSEWNEWQMWHRFGVDFADATGLALVPSLTARNHGGCG